MRVEAFPIGLDTENFLELSRSPAALNSFDRMAAHGAFRSLIVGVDRLDYSKGIPERLEGFEQYLTDHPDLVRKVLYLQVAPSSRAEVEAYQALRANVLALAGRINATWAEMDHAPMMFVNRNYSPRRACGHLSRRQGRAGDAAARRHEPGRQGVCRRPGPGRSRRADPLALRRRGAADDARR